MHDGQFRTINRAQSEQINMTIHRAQYFRLTYMNVLKINPKDRCLFENVVSI